MRVAQTSNYSRLENTVSKVKQALLGLRYLEPSVDLSSLPFNALLGLVSQHELSGDMSPERMASAMLVYLRNADHWEEMT